MCDLTFIFLSFQDNMQKLLQPLSEKISGIQVRRKLHIFMFLIHLIKDVKGEIIRSAKKCTSRIGLSTLPGKTIL